MAKAIAGAALIAGAAVLTVATGGIGGIAAIAAVDSLETSIFVGAVAGAAAIGASLELSSIADALTDTVTTPQTVRSPAAPWQVIYGNVRCGGTQTDLNSYGANFHYCDMIVTLACHPCVGVQQHTEVIAGDATFPSFGGLYINGQGMQWRNNAQGGGDKPGTYPYDFGQQPFGYTTSNDIQDLNQNHYSTGTHVYMETYNGSGKSYQNLAQVDNQVSQFYIAQGPSGHWDDTCTMMIDPTGKYSADGQPKGFTYAYLRLLYASNLWAGGIPESLRFDVRGKNDIWDPRLKGGAGGYAYTNNAALVIADYMTNPYFGMGYKMSDFDVDALIAAANICDTQVPLAAGGTIAQYTINGTFLTNENPGSVLKKMLAACDGDLSQVGGKWFIFPGAYVYPSATIDNTMMLGPIRVKTGQKGRDLINAVKGTFICPAAVDTIGSPNIFLNEQPNIFNGQWQKQAFPPYAMDPQHGYLSDLWLAKDGQKLYKQLDLPFVTSPATCQRLAKQALLKNRIGNGLDDTLNQGLTFTVECNLRAYDIVPHDTVWVEYPRFNWKAPPSGFNTSTPDIPQYVYTEFEVTDTNLELREQDGAPPMFVYELTLRATSPDIYLWNLSDELTMTDNKFPQFANTMQVPSPTNFVVESGHSTVIQSLDGHLHAAILCTWSAPGDGYVKNGGRYVLQLLPVNPTAITYTSVAGTEEVTLSSTAGYSAGDEIVLEGAGAGGSLFTSVIFSINGNVVTLVDSPPTSVRNGVVHTAGWQTVAELDGRTTRYSIANVSYGAQYYVQIYSLNSAGRTSDANVAGPITVSTGEDQFANGQVVYTPGTTLAAIQAGASGNVLLFNANFSAGNVGWGYNNGWSIVPGAGFQGSPYYAQFMLQGSGAMVNEQQIPCDAGSVLAASCFFNGINFASGKPFVAINWYNASGGLISASQSVGYALPGIGWTRVRVVGTAPPGTSFAKIGCIVFGEETGIWLCGGFGGNLHLKSLGELPDDPSGPFRKLLYVSEENVLSASTALLPQGSIIPVWPFDIAFSAETTSAGVSSIDFSWTADTLSWPDGSSLPTPAGTKTVTGLSAATVYYIFVRCSATTGAIQIYTPLPVSATDINANVWQAMDGYVSFNAFSVTTPSAPPSGSSSGSGSGGLPRLPCPDADEIVREKTRGLIRVGDVKVGEWIEGAIYDDKGSDVGREFRRVVGRSIRYSEAWYRVEGCKVSPFHPVRYIADGSWGKKWLFPHEVGRGDRSPGLRVQLRLNAGDYEQANYLLFDAEGAERLVMHNMFPFPPLS